MPVKIRLSRKGRTKRPLYHIVVADSRAPRDGRYIEKLGLYNTITNPATIDLDFNKTLDWLLKGAQPTETCRTILSQKGVLYKKHLLEGVKKGAFSEDEANKRFETWLNEKEAKVKAQIDKIEKEKDTDYKKRLEAEVKVNEERALQIAKKNSELLEAEKKAKEAATEVKVAAETTDKAASVEIQKENTPVEETSSEVPVQEQAIEEKIEEAVEEVTGETEEPVEEVKESDLEKASSEREEKKAEEEKAE